LRERIAHFIQRLLRLVGLKTIDHQFLFSYMLIFLFAAISTVALFLSMGSGAAAINVAGKQRMLSQRMAKEAVLAAEGLVPQEKPRATMQEFQRSHRDLLEGSEERGLPGVQKGAIRGQLKKVEGLWREYRQALNAYLEAPNPETLEPVRDLSPRVLKEMDAAVGMMEASAKAQARYQKYLSMGMTGFILILVVLGRMFGLTHLMNEIHLLRDRLKAVAGGDFTRRLTIDWEDDEVGEAFGAYNQLLDQQSQTVQGIQNQAGQLASASEELSSTADEINRNSQTTRQRVEDVSGSAQEVNSVVQDVANNIQTVSQSAQQATETTHGGQQAVKRAAQRLDQLKESTGRVTEMTAAIESIAKKTDLLALNAAIEAANAGEHGKGFAVVADEVRKLAEQTSSATGQVNEIVDELGNQSDASVQAMDQVESTMGEVLQAIEHTSETANQIAAAAEELSATMAETTDNMGEIGSNVDHVADSVSQVEEAARQLEGLAHELRSALDQYRVA
jgi:methyl-accepting chemotaxis protein